MFWAFWEFLYGLGGSINRARLLRAIESDVELECFQFALAKSQCIAIACFSTSQRFSKKHTSWHMLPMASISPLIKGLKEVRVCRASIFGKKAMHFAKRSHILQKMRHL
jgi:hypothetical protein